MAETKPIPVRLSPELILRLDKAAQAMGTTRAGVIKLCLNSFLDAYERDGKIALPLDWRLVLERSDGRTVHARAGHGDSPGSPAGAPKDSIDLGAPEKPISFSKAEMDRYVADRIAESDDTGHSGGPRRPPRRGVQRDGTGRPASGV